MSGLYSVLLRLKARKDATISPAQGYHANALFMSLIHRVNPDLSARVHDSNGVKPFTLSPLQGRFRRCSAGMALIAGESYSVRMTFLEDELFAGFMDATARAAGEDLDLDSAQFNIEAVVTAEPGSTSSGASSLQEMLDCARSDRELSLIFASPTAFRSGGKRNVLFPQPQLIFGSWQAKWSALTSVALPATLTQEALREHARVSKYQLETRMLDFGSYQEVGFQGKCSFELGDGLSDEAVTAMNALADLAFYCGTGAKTTMGMGQTRRVNYARPVSGGAGS